METKKWYQSKTIWGLVLAFVGYVLTYFLQVPDLQVPTDATFEELQQYADAIKNSNGSVQAIMSQLMMLVGTILAFIGRVKADTKITM